MRTIITAAICGALLLACRGAQPTTTSSPARDTSQGPAERGPADACALASEQLARGNAPSAGLLADLRGDDVARRRLAASSLDACPDRDALVALTLLILADADQMVRSIAAEQCDLVGLRCIEAAVDHEDAAIRVRAAMAFWPFIAESATDDLRARALAEILVGLGSQDPLFRLEVVETLTKIDGEADDAIVRALLDALDRGPALEVAVAIINSLGSRGQAASIALPRLHELTDEGPCSIRMAAGAAALAVEGDPLPETVCVFEPLRCVFCK